MFIASCLGTVSKTAFVLAFDEKPAVRVGCTLFPYDFFRFGEVNFFSVGKAQLIYFCFQFLLILLNRLGYFDFFALMLVGRRFDMR